jgi:hypothetical protein
MNGMEPLIDIQGWEFQLAGYQHSVAAQIPARWRSASHSLPFMHIHSLNPHPVSPRDKYRHRNGRNENFASGSRVESWHEQGWNVTKAGVTLGEGTGGWRMEGMD